MQVKSRRCWFFVYGKITYYPVQYVMFVRGSRLSRIRTSGNNNSNIGNEKLWISLVGRNTTMDWGTSSSKYLKPVYHCSRKNDSDWKRSSGSVLDLIDDWCNRRTKLFNKAGWTFDVLTFAKKKKIPSAILENRKTSRAWKQHKFN
jgi:hypothetical protein